MRSRLLSLVAAGALAVVLLAGPSFARTSEDVRSMASGPAVSPVAVSGDSGADEGMGERCEQMHQDMIGNMGDDMRRMHDEMMGRMDSYDPAS